jgi:streptogramin lyase
MRCHSPLRLSGSIMQKRLFVGSILLGLTIACSAQGENSLVPASESQVDASDSSSASASSVIKLTPPRVTLNGNGRSKFVTITERRYKGKFKVTSTCARVAKVSPSVGLGPTLIVKVTAVHAGSCVVTFSDKKKNQARLPTTVIASTPSPSPSPTGSPTPSASPSASPTPSPTPRASPTTSPPVFGPYYTIPGSNVYPSWMTEGPDGNLWFSDEVGSSYQVVKMTTGGVFSQYVPTQQSVGTLISGPNQLIWFGTAADGIATLSTSGAYSQVGGTYSFGGRFAYGSDGNVWGAAGAYVGKVTPTGVATYYSVPSGPADIEQIVPGLAGSLWFVEHTGNRVGRITTAGVITEYTLPDLNSLPESLTLGSDGNIWVAPEEEQYLLRVSPNGTMTKFPVNQQTDVQLVTGNGPFIYGVDSTGSIIQFNVNTGQSQIALPPANTFPNMTVTSVAVGGDRNLWLIGEGNPTSILRLVYIPGGTQPQARASKHASRPKVSAAAIRWR